MSRPAISTPSSARRCGSSCGCGLPLSCASVTEPVPSTGCLSSLSRSGGGPAVPGNHGRRGVMISAASPGQQEQECCTSSLCMEHVGRSNRSLDFPCALITVRIGKSGTTDRTASPDGQGEGAVLPLDWPTLGRRPLNASED